MKTPRQAFDVPAEALEVEYEVKKSRFIARSANADSREAAMALLEAARQDYPDARHHCWAYLVGNPHSPTTVAMSDDGEPSGTAGKPILNVLQHKSVGDVMVIVIRYFGGIKLGAGGLVRAYSHAAQLAMTDLPTCAQIPMQECRVMGDYALEQGLRHWLSGCGGRVLAVDYAEGISVQVQLPEAELDALQEYLRGVGARVANLES